MPYNQALKLWGAQKIDARNQWQYNYYSFITEPAEPCDPATVTVTFVHECEYDDDYAKILIEGNTGKATIDIADFNLAATIAELIDIAGDGLTR